MIGWPPLGQNDLLTSCKIQAQAELFVNRNVIRNGGLHEWLGFLSSKDLLKLKIIPTSDVFPHPLN